MAQDGPKGFKVCVCGGAGGIGQPLCMLMAMSPYVDELSVYDLSISMVPAQGVATDLSHLEYKAKVRAYTLEKDDRPVEKLEECLTGCSLVLVPAGVPRKPGQDRADLLGTNAGIAKNIVEACAKFCPEAILCLIVNPVNSVVPAMCRLYEKKGLDPKRICGVTTLDGVRANKFASEVTKKPVAQLNVPVVCGHAGATILPLFSQEIDVSSITKEELEALDSRVQNAGTEVVSAKGGKGSATLSMAYAGARFAIGVLRGLSGEDTVEAAYVKTDVVEGMEFFATKVTWGEKGQKIVHPLGELSEYEKGRLEQAKEQLKGEIEEGLKYAETAELNF